MTSCRSRSRIMAPPVSSFAPARPWVLQRQSVSPVRHGAGNTESESVGHHSGHITRGYDFSRVRIHSDFGLTSSTSDARGIFINGPDKETSKPDAPKTAPKQQETPPPKEKTPPPKEKTPAKAKCPTDVQVINIDPITDKDFGKNGWMTGFGGVAYMEVSGGGRTDWDGTMIQETVKQTKNTCGARARKVCSNESGENVDFKVGAATKVLGQKMTALANTFYDVHMFALKDISVLHEKGLKDCEVQCEQSYQCDGKKFGPEFIITYKATKDTIAKTYDVTRVKLDKAPKATPTAAPDNP
jgi:hypothetical protein